MAHSELCTKMNQKEKEFDRLFRQEFKDLTNKLIWQTDDGVYEVFDRYKIVPENKQFRVFCSATDIGIFTTTKIALCWCIADKNKQYNLAREIREVDQKLTALNNDINARAQIGDRSKQPQFTETIGTKLETKIIRKKQLEAQLNKCVNYAKYSQQKEFNNETIRTSRPAVKERR